MPDPTRHKQAQQPYYIIGGVAVTLFLVAAIVVYFLLQNQNRAQSFLEATATAEAISAAASAGEAGALSAAVTGTAEAAATQTAVVAAYTPTPTPTNTPTPTPRPTFIPNQIGVFYGDGDPQPFTLADAIETGDEFVQLSLNNDANAIGQDAIIMVQPNSQIIFENVTSDSAAEAGISLILYEGSDIFLETGDYVTGADISPIEDTRVSFLVSGSCMSVQYEAEGGEIAVACYEGVCSYRAEERADLTPLERGSLLRYDLVAREPIETKRIPTSDAAYYQNILLRTSGGREVYNQCVLPLFPPTSTPTPTPTNTPIPTKTLPPTSSSGGSSPSNPTNTPVASGSATLPESPGLGAVGLTAVTLGVGLVFGIVLVGDRPLKRP
jgi:hypothetical protein